MEKSYINGGAMKKSCLVFFLFFSIIVIPWTDTILAAGGGEASEIVVVADTRVISNGILRYFADVYNSNIVLFAVWSVVLTAAYGGFLGFLMDRIMSRTGLDLKSRKIVEH